MQEQHYIMNNFDFSLYEDTEPENITPVKNPISRKKSSFDFSLYEDNKSEIPKRVDSSYEKYYKSPEYSKEDLKKMSLEDRRQYAQDLKTEREYLQSAGFVKNALSQLSFGFSEREENLKPNQNELLQTPGILAGSVVPLAGAFKLLQKGVQAIPKAYSWSQRAARTLGAGVIGGSNEAARQVGKGEETDVGKIAEEAGTFAAFDTVLRTVPKAYQWLKGLTKPQQEAILVKNVIPENMSPSDYKFYQDEIVPELQKIGEAEYSKAYETAKQENDLLFKQEMANVQAKHENDLYKIQQIEAQHAERAKEIEKANNLVLKEHQLAQQEWEATKARENVVRESLDAANKKIESNRNFKLTEGEDVGIRPAAPYHFETPVETKIGNIISDNKIENPTIGGERTTAAIRASAKADQKEVAKLYQASDELNRGVVDTHPELANELRNTITHFEEKGNLSTQEQELVRNAKTTLNNLVEFDEAGNAIVFKEVDNQFLLDQAKALRQKMYYDYGESNATGIFNPLVDTYQDAAKEAAINAGNVAAAEANDIARSAHSEWARLYKNRYIRQWRNLSSDKPTSLYEGSLNIDNYRQIDRVLSRTNSGQNLSAEIRRDVINKKLDKFYKNPSGHSLEEFNNTLNNLSPILEPGEKAQISNIFKQARKSNHLSAEKIVKSKELTEPKLQKVPKKNISHPTSVSIPVKKPVPITSEMKAAGKLININPEKVMKMTDTPTGLKELSSKLSGSSNGERLLHELKKKKVGRILYKKSYTGNELHKTVKENFDVLSEILGKEEATLFLESSEKIGEEKVTKERLIKVAKKYAFVKSLVSLGFL
jgi:hypothetical protein